MEVAVLLYAGISLLILLGLCSAASAGDRVKVRAGERFGSTPSRRARPMSTPHR